MSRKSKIRWSEQDKREITNTVRVFNSKLTRLAKKNPEIADYLPSRINTKTLYDKIETRADFKRELNSLKRFMRKGAEKPILTDTGIKTTAWEKREVGLKVQQINARKTRERKEANISTYKGTMGSIEANNLKPKMYNIDKIKERDWKKFIANVEKQVQSKYTNTLYQQYKANYLKAVDNIMGVVGTEVKRIINQIDDETFYKLYYDDPVLQIDFVYDPYEAEYIADNIVEHLNNGGFY